MKHYFVLEKVEHLSKNYFLLHPDHDLIDKFFHSPMTGSYMVLQARVLGLHFADYVRFCRDILGCKIQGKNSMYPYIFFRKTDEVQLFVRLLNKRMEYLEKVYDNPKLDIIDYNESEELNEFTA